MTVFEEKWQEDDKLHVGFNPYLGSSYAQQLCGISLLISNNIFANLKENDLETLKNLEVFYRQLAYDYKLVYKGFNNFLEKQKNENN